MSYTGKRPSFTTAALVPQSTAPANSISGDLYINDGTGSLEAGTYKYNGAAFVRLDNREPNLIINGGFDFWQRGTSFSNVSGVYTADRFRVDDNTTNTQQTLSRTTTTPDVATNYSLQVTCDTGGAMAATDFYQIRQLIEGFNIRGLVSQPMTISFNVTATVTGTYSIFIGKTGNDWGYRTSYTVNASNTWERKHITIPADPFTSGATAWNFTTGRGLVLNFMVAAGASQQGAANTVWGDPAAVFAVTGQANAMATAGNTFRLSNISLVKGNNNQQAFQRSAPTLAAELVLCQRYYTKSYNLDTNLGTATNVGIESFYSDGHPIVDYRSMIWTSRFSVSMRAAPTITTYDANGVLGNIRVGNDFIAVVADFIAEKSFRVIGTGLTSTDRAMVVYHYAADSEIP